MAPCSVSEIALPMSVPSHKNLSIDVGRHFKFKLPGSQFPLPLGKFLIDQQHCRHSVFTRYDVIRLIRESPKTLLFLCRIESHPLGPDRFIRRQLDLAMFRFFSIELNIFVNLHVLADIIR